MGNRVAGPRDAAADGIGVSGAFDAVGSVGQGARGIVIGPYIIALDKVACDAAIDEHAVVVVAGENIGVAGARPSDGVSAAGDLNTVDVGHPVRAACAQADKGALYLIAAGATVQEHAIVAVAGDVVAQSGVTVDVAPDGVAGALNLDAVGAIGQGSSVDVDAEVTVLDQGAAGRAVQEHAVLAVARDDVEQAGRNRGADGVVGACHLDAIADVGHTDAAVGTDANELAHHPIASGPAANQHAIVAVAGDDVARSGRGTADGIVVAGDLHAVAAVGLSGAAGIDANVVALHLITGGAAVDEHAIVAVA